MHGQPHIRLITKCFVEGLRRPPNTVKHGQCLGWELGAAHRVRTGYRFGQTVQCLHPTITLRSLKTKTVFKHMNMLAGFRTFEKSLSSQALAFLQNVFHINRWLPASVHCTDFQLYIFFCMIPNTLNSKISSNPMTGLDRPWGFQEVQAPRFKDNRRM